MNHTPMDPLGDEPPVRGMRSRGTSGALLPLGTDITIHAPHAPKWHGTAAKIIKVNPKRYKVETPKGHRINVPHKMVKEV